MEAAKKLAKIASAGDEENERIEAAKIIRKAPEIE